MIELKTKTDTLLFTEEKMNWKEIKYQHRIFIRKECKEQIINQLSMIGIDSKYIFPDLSNGVSCIVSSIKRRNLEFNKQFHTPFD